MLLEAFSQKKEQQSTEVSTQHKATLVKPIPVTSEDYASLTAASFFPFS